jgi:hypothetical protein
MSIGNTWLGAVTAAGAIALVACGGGSGQETGGGGTTTSSSSGGAAPTELSATIDGVDYHWSQTTDDATNDVRVLEIRRRGQARVVHGQQPELTLYLGDGFHTGEGNCVHLANELAVWFTDGSDYITADTGGACAISVTQVPTKMGERWVGTFSGTVVSLDKKTLSIENGKFNLVYP